MKHCGESLLRGTPKTMNNNIIGCFGKLAFAEMESLQRTFGTPDSYWADAVPFFVIEGALCSIDTIALDPARVSDSVGIGIFHALNDIYAAKGVPRYFSAALTVPKDFSLESLLEVGAVVRSCADLARCSIGKLHTNRSEGIAMLTACVMGSGSSPSVPLPKKGSVWLLDELKDPSSAIANFDLSRMPQRIKSRERADKVSIRMKDVSGDGLAGSLYQLCLRHNVSITLYPGVLSSLVSSAALDACSRDRNYGDYSNLIVGLEKHNSSVMRDVLFEPQIFGPLVCLTYKNADMKSLGGVEIGKFTTGQTLLRFEPA